MTRIGVALLTLLLAAVPIDSQAARHQLIGASPPDALQPSATAPLRVVGAILTEQSVATGLTATYLYPIAVYQNGRYQGVSPILVDPAPVIRGRAPDVARRQSPLNVVKRFTVFLEGRPAGRMAIARLTLLRIMCVQALVGVGRLDWFWSFSGPGAFIPYWFGTDARLRLTAAALSGDVHGTDFRVREHRVTAEERRTLLSLAQTELRRLRAERKDLRFSAPAQLVRAATVDVSQNRRPAIVAEFVASAAQSGWQAHILLITRVTEAGTPMLSWGWVDGPYPRNERHGLVEFLDIEGNGTAQLVVQSTFGEAINFEILAVRDGRYVRVLNVPAWGC